MNSFCIAPSPSIINIISTMCSKNKWLIRPDQLVATVEPPVRLRDHPSLTPLVLFRALPVHLSILPPT